MNSENLLWVRYLVMALILIFGAIHQAANNGRPPAPNPQSRPVNPNTQVYPPAATIVMGLLVVTICYCLGKMYFEYNIMRAAKREQARVLRRSLPYDAAKWQSSADGSAPDVLDLSPPRPR